MSGCPPSNVNSKTRDELFYCARRLKLAPERAATKKELVRMIVDYKKSHPKNPKTSTTPSKIPNLARSTPKVPNRPNATIRAVFKGDYPEFTIKNNSFDFKFMLCIDPYEEEIFKEAWMTFFDGYHSNKKSEIELGDRIRGRDFVISDIEHKGNGTVRFTLNHVPEFEISGYYAAVVMNKLEYMLCKRYKWKFTRETPDPTNYVSKIVPFESSAEIDLEMDWIVVNVLIDWIKFIFYVPREGWKKLSKDVRANRTSIFTESNGYVLYPVVEYNHAYGNLGINIDVHPNPIAFLTLKGNYAKKVISKIAKLEK